MDGTGFLRILTNGWMMIMYTVNVRVTHFRNQGIQKEAKGKRRNSKMRTFSDKTFRESLFPQMEFTQKNKTIY